MLNGASAQQSSLSLGHLSRTQVLWGGDILGLQTLSTGSQKFLNRDPLGAQACPAYSRLTWLSCLRSWQADPQDAEWAVSLNVCASLAGQAPVVQDSGSSHLS